MNLPPVTIEDQRELLKRRIEGWQAAEESLLAEARNRTDADAWRDAEIVLSGWHSVMAMQPAPSADTGLVEQQRLFRLGKRG